MLLTIALVLLILWALGMTASFTLYGFLHIVLIVAVAMFLIQVIEGA